MVICFDFDGVISDKRIERLANKFIEGGNEIWVVTMRKENEFNRSKILPLLNRLKLTFFNVIFCDEKPKINFLEGIGADIYIDNVSDEFETISCHTEIVPLLWIN